MYWYDAVFKKRFDGILIFIWCLCTGINRGRDHADFFFRSTFVSRNIYWPKKHSHRNFNRIPWSLDQLSIEISVSCPKQRSHRNNNRIPYILNTLSMEFYWNFYVFCYLGCFLGEVPGWKSHSIMNGNRSAFCVILFINLWYFSTGWVHYVFSNRVKNHHW